jgi:hypothetical protein
MSKVGAGQGGTKSIGQGGTKSTSPRPAPHIAHPLNKPHNKRREEKVQQLS